MQSHTDIVEDGLVFRLTPQPWWPYLKLMRLDRPIGTWLLLLPCWWGLALAPHPDGYGLADLVMALLFGLGALVMRSAGCVINDMFDRDIDRQVTRTAGRPLASGALSLTRAMLLLGVLLAVGLAILVNFNRATILLGAASLLLVVPYPLMKRITWWPQAFLGLTFNWGALVGWTAVTGALDWPAVALYAAGFFWTLGYDTIYAHQDKADDAIVGVKSTARLLGDRSGPFIAGFYVAMLGLLALALALRDASTWGYVALALPAALLGRQLLVWRMDDPAKSLRQFQANRDAGLAVVAAILLGVLAG